MDTLHRSLLSEIPYRTKSTYKWADVFTFGVCTILFGWFLYEKNPFAVWWAGYFLTIVFPDFIFTNFPKTVGKQQRQTQFAEILSANKSLAVVCWMVAFAAIALAILAGLGVAPFNAILATWPIVVFGHIPAAVVSVLWVVFCPVYRVGTFIEKREWPRWVWAVAASAVAFAILYRQDWLS